MNDPKTSSPKLPKPADKPLPIHPLLSPSSRPLTSPPTISYMPTSLPSTLSTSLPSIPESRTITCPICLHTEKYVLYDEQGNRKAAACDACFHTFRARERKEREGGWLTSFPRLLEEEEGVVLRIGRVFGRRKGSGGKSIRSEAKIDPIQYDPGSPFKYNNFVYCINLPSSPSIVRNGSSDGPLQPGTTPPPEVAKQFYHTTH
ncbi:hypothetical protein CC78DRAFT_579800 [Lojkania enalia]|uniref:Uncharacterized protein n=1 Tax=Lojkania enalia TaxID=147567 RepID=A0A9P4N6S9_9PLEO|nr:hypothetical protein CC78DRAFT_579800 [Didymosphaeria enalia]